MTAVVGILNKKAVAIAADSAVTIGSGKIFNKANKIFTLSKYHPVGVMIHNVGSFMGVPWETIIKMYRKQLKDKSYDKLEEYQIDFVNYIKSQDFFCEVGQQQLELKRFFLGINGFLINAAEEKVPKDAADKEVEYLKLLKEGAEEYISIYSKITDILPDFVGYTYDNFDAYVEPILQDLIDFSFEGHIISPELRVLLKKAYYHELIVKEFSTSNFTGIVITGFGEKELFPSLIPLNVYFGFEGKLRYFVNSVKGSVITERNPTDICTFAQSDVMFTILTGVAPDLKETYNLNFKNFLDNYDEVLLKNYTNDKGDLMYLLNRINKDAITKVFTDIMEEVIQKKYISKLYDAVAGLSKEDLGEMAESLIYLTYLQRRITNAEESVGGPVDVALLSKGDGFIWLKRKHYFSPELNSHFFKNYFN